MGLLTPTELKKDMYLGPKFSISLLNSGSHKGNVVNDLSIILPRFVPPKKKGDKFKSEVRNLTSINDGSTRSLFLKI